MILVFETLGFQVGIVAQTQITKKGRNLVIYRIANNGWQCEYCYSDLCFCLNSSIRYYILDSTHIQIVGDIFKSEFLQVIIY